MTEKLKKLLTIPNILSIVRVLLIPVFCWAFLTGRDILALALVVVSGATDKLDGTIARRFNMVSEAGKWLDPMADKFTQVALALVLFMRFHASGIRGCAASRGCSWASSAKRCSCCCSRCSC